MSTKVSYDEIVKVVAQKFISGADEDFLRKVEKTAKGARGSFKNLKTPDKKILLSVSPGPTFLFWLKHHDVAVKNQETKEVFEMSSAKDWPKFYEGVKDEIEKERKNRK